MLQFSYTYTHTNNRNNMNFNDLPQEQKEQLHKQLLSNAQSIGGVNFFLQMIEDIKEQKPHPLLNTTATYHYSKGTVSWGKNIYKDTLTALLHSIRYEEKKGDLLEGQPPKEFKTTMNMMKALKPVILTVKSKVNEELEGFSFPILDTTQPKKTQVSLMFKIIFFYNIDFAKKALNYKVKEEMNES